MHSAVACPRRELLGLVPHSVQPFFFSETMSPGSVCFSAKRDQSLEKMETLGTRLERNFDSESRLVWSGLAVSPGCLSSAPRHESEISTSGGGFLSSFSLEGASL